MWKHIPIPVQLVIGTPTKKDLNTTDSLGWMNEVRLVSVLMINFPGLEYSWNTANIIQQVVINIQKIANHYSGVIVNAMSTINKGKEKAHH